MSYLIKFPFLQGVPTQTPSYLPSLLEVSEVEMLRITLEKAQYTLSNLTKNALAKTTLEQILRQNALSHVNVDTLLQQIQTISHPPQYETHYQKTYLSPLFADQNAKYALHDLARIGDLTLIKNLVENHHYDVNATDVFSTTPLHMAAMYGHRDVIEYLISQNAQVNSKSYIDYKYLWSFAIYSAYTPLDLALKYSPNLETITYLIENNAISANWDNLQRDLAEGLENALLTANYEKFDLILSKLELLSIHSQSGMWVQFDEPMLTIAFLQIEAKATTDPKFHQRLVDAIDILTQADQTQTYEHFLIAKNLLHTFPSYNEYLFSVGNSQISLPAAGYYSLEPATQLAISSLTAYCDQLSTHSVKDYVSFQSRYPLWALGLDNFENYLNLKHNTFNNVLTIFTETVQTLPKSALREVSEKLYQDYLDGKTILIATGWVGHGIDVILDKDLNLFMVANGGNSHSALAPGLNAYNHQFNINAEDIYNILNNDDRMSLEFKYFYDLGLVKNTDFSFTTDPQIYGNCAWYSQQIAEKSLLTISLFKATHDHALSQQLADLWYEDWDHFHQSYVLKEYLEQPSLEIAALGDILVNYCGSMNSEQQIENAKLILDSLTLPEYIDAFKNYFQQYEPSFSNELKLFIEENDYFLNNKLMVNQLENHSSEPISLTLQDVLEQMNENDPLAHFKESESRIIAVEHSPYFREQVSVAHGEITIIENFG